MDNGEVIQGLNEGWTFGGATLMEWISGFIMCMIVGSVLQLKPIDSMPIFLLIGIGTAFGLAGLRRSFPDAERGVMNYFATNLGFPPVGIPKPAKIQPYWSGAPIHEIDEQKDYMYLDLDQVFVSSEEDITKEQIHG